ncbi:hypothetical protein [Macrococcus capreoli]|uniref:hypothetical protein n=1 Tax=Macrococcus capreoli TaxID=2982690 RepID=UPI003EE69DB4
MNNKTINDLFSVISANLISVIISIIVVLIVPKFVSVEQYGYWQLYLFYTSYVGFMHFGHIDGIYLKYGGSNYDDLDKKHLKQQFLQLSISQIILAIFVSIATILFIDDYVKYFLINMTLFSMILVNIKMYFQFILQSTSRFKQYSKSVMLERILYVLFIICVIFIFPKTLSNFIFADLISKSISLVFVMYICKDIITFKKFNNLIDLKHFYIYIKIGINLMFANIASMLIIGIIRFAIELSNGVKTFGKVSLTLSLANFLMIFINAIGVVLFPIMRRMNPDESKEFYLSLRNILMIFVTLSLIIYFPLTYLLSIHLPKYKDSLVYAGILFPMLIFEAKNILLINTYLKNIRQEKKLLIINGISLIVSGIFTIILLFFKVDVEYFVILITLILFLRALIGEFITAKYLGINILLDNIKEGLVALNFMLITFYFHGLIATFYYFIIWSIFVLLNAKNNIKSIRFILSKI